MTKANVKERAVVDFVLQMAELGTPMRIKYIPSIAFSSTRHSPLPDRPLKSPGKNWVKALERRRPELVARRVKAMDWNRHDKNTYEKIEHWFDVIGGVLEDSAIVRENVYNMDETRGYALHARFRKGRCRQSRPVGLPECACQERW